MLNLLQIISTLLRVFAFGILGITSGIAVYVLLQWCLAETFGERDARNGAGGVGTGRENHKQDIRIYRPPWRANLGVSTAFTRDRR